MSRNDLDEVHFCFPAKLKYLSWVHGLFDQLADDYGFDEGRRNRLQVVVSEAFTNAFVHGCRSDGNRFITLNILAGQDQFVIDVADDGAGLAAIPPEASWAEFDPEREGGRGLELMRRLTDEMVLSETPQGGLTVSMHFRASRLPAARDLAKRNVAHRTRGGTMELQVETSGEVDIIRVDGRLDLAGTNALKDEIRRRLQENRTQLILNLEKVDFINSSGLGALVSVLKDVRLAGGRLVLSDLAPYVQEIFAITQLSNVFEIFGAESEARATFQQPVTV